MNKCNNVNGIALISWAVIVAGTIAAIAAYAVDGIIEGDIGILTSSLPVVACISVALTAISEISAVAVAMVIGYRMVSVMSSMLFGSVRVGILSYIFLLLLWKFCEPGVCQKFVLIATIVCAAIAAMMVICLIVWGMVTITDDYDYPM